jgi:hypothetical protein
VRSIKFGARALVVPPLRALGRASGVESKKPPLLNGVVPPFFEPTSARLRSKERLEERLRSNGSEGPQEQQRCAAKNAEKAFARFLFLSARREIAFFFALFDRFARTTMLLHCVPPLARPTHAFFEPSFGTIGTFNLR